jgi:hypothetical protein
MRDSAVTYFARIPGQMYKVPYVVICENGMKSDCEFAEKCDCYHIYTRPSTDEIIKRLYKKAKGNNLKRFESGATLDGEVAGNLYCGHAVMTWPNGSTYVGQWKEDLRDGMGLFRMESGVEYHGEWKDGKKHGFGIMHHPNGEEYVGEFIEGSIEGVGRLTRYEYSHSSNEN